MSMSNRVTLTNRPFFRPTVMAAVDLRLVLVAQLYNSMHGLGTDERALSRIIAIRSDVISAFVLFVQRIPYKDVALKKQGL